MSVLILASHAIGFAWAPGAHGFGTSLPQKIAFSLSSTSSVNIELENVKNMRDMTTAYEKMLSSKIIRTGCVSKASESDVRESCVVAHCPEFY